MINYTECREGLRALDVGIEPYFFAERLLNRCPEIELSGIAYGSEAVETTETVGGRSIPVKKCNIEEMEWPYPDESMDVVIMGAIIEHLFDPLPALKEARRILDSDGKLVLSTPNAVRLSQRGKVLLGKNPFDGFPLESKYNRHNHEWTHNELEDIFAVAGFSIKRFSTARIKRDGPKRVVEIGTLLNDTLADQLVYQCSVAEPENRMPTVYRQGLTETTESV